MEFLHFYSIVLVLACEELVIFSEPVFLGERGFGVLIFQLRFSHLSYGRVRG